MEAGDESKCRCDQHNVETERADIMARHIDAEHDNSDDLNQFVVGSDPTGDEEMERVTVRLPNELNLTVELLADSGEFPSRSEAIRNALREAYL